MSAFLLGWKENNGEGEEKLRGEESREMESVNTHKIVISNVEMFPPLDLPNSFQSSLFLCCWVFKVPGLQCGFQC